MNNLSNDVHSFENGNKDGRLGLKSQIIVCPNRECREYTITLWLHRYEKVAGSEKLSKEAINTWKLKPQSAAKPVPDYVPKPIRDDYQEACLIVTLSPKASATLARRCLQGMIRDFFRISKARLIDEVNALKEHLDSQTWNAIDAVRNIGNIGAHMERDINTIIDVDPNEASLLIGLIETLIEEWYVHRHDRNARMEAIIAVAAEKKEEKTEALAQNKEAE